MPAGRSRGVVRDAAGADGWYHVMPTAAVLLLPLYVALGVSAAFAVDALDLRAQRSLSGRSLRPAVYHSDLALRHARRVPGIARARTVAAALRAQPDGVGRRRLPERAAGNGRSRARWSIIAVVVAVAAVHRARRISGPSKDRSWISPDVRRRDRIRGLGKRYVIGARENSTTRCATHRGGDAPVPPPCARRLGAESTTILGAARTSRTNSPRRRGRRHRRQRRRQVDAAEDSVAHHRRRPKATPTFTAASDRCSRSAPDSIPISPAARTSFSTAPSSACARPKSSGSSTRSSSFAEVEEFIDTPVKHYSSGMYVRLAFAVAAHLEPES